MTNLPPMPPDIAWHDVVRHGEWDALRSYTEDCLARLRVAEYELKWMRGLVKERQDAWNTTPAWLVLEWIDFALAAIGSLPAPPTERSKDTI